MNRRDMMKALPMLSALLCITRSDERQIDGTQRIGSGPPERIVITLRPDNDAAVKAVVDNIRNDGSLRDALNGL